MTVCILQSCVSVCIFANIITLEGYDVIRELDTSRPFPENRRYYPANTLSVQFKVV